MYVYFTSNSIIQIMYMDKMDGVQLVHYIISGYNSRRMAAMKAVTHSTRQVNDVRLYWFTLVTFPL